MRGNAPIHSMACECVMYADCGWACNLRCSANSRPKLCSRACLKCCSVCRCVPAGTAGNKETCGKCYTDWTTHGNKTKCP
uniref:Uncharacterized protein n=1 Tax=Aegilops tauschii subsp. strangulata TaxID=200361 RepID=A0A453C5W7_AEGTS